MNFQQIILNFLITIISLIIFYLLKGYWPKYFEAKGTNQATKEDIGEITEIIENIKSDLTHQNELLKAQLSFHNQHRLNIKTAEREAIFDFNKRISAWTYSIVRFTFSAYNIDNYKDLKFVSADFSKRLYECDLAEAHLTLFIHDQEFIELKRDLIVSIIELERITAASIQQAYFSYSNCEFHLELYKDEAKKQSEHRNLLYEELELLTENHGKDTIQQFKQVHLLQVRMTQLVNKRLKQLEEDEKKLA